MFGIPFPVRFKRVTGPLGEMARARLYESSGSEHSAGNSPELSDLVDSFMEKQGKYEDDEKEMMEKNKKEKEEKVKGSDDSRLDLDSRGLMESLLGVGLNGDDEDAVRRRILEYTEIAWWRLGMVTGEGFERRLMCELRERGLDAGLCKSRWEKSSRFPAGEYEYVDVMAEDERYIVEIGLAGEFEIARPTSRYSSLLAVLPPIFVGKSDALKQVVRVMCNAAKESIKDRDMHLPPWRRSGYMQGKWFGSRKRTTNSSPSRGVSDSLGVSAGKLSVGFVDVSETTARFCRGEVRGKEKIKAGNLAAVFNGL